MSQELECSPDYLINEAMRHYARSQGKLRQTMAPTNQGRPMPAPPHASMGAPMQGAQRPMPNATMPRPPGSDAAADGQQRAPARADVAAAGPWATPSSSSSSRSMRPMPQMQQGGGMQQQGYPPRPAPPPQAPPQPPAYPQSNGIPVLYAVFEGQKYPIVKDEFYIGRSNKSCDLIVKDPNVSRQHARIVRHQGQYWMVDMGSTNGIEFQGDARRPQAPSARATSFASAITRSSSPTANSASPLFRIASGAFVSARRAYVLARSRGVPGYALVARCGRAPPRISRPRQIRRGMLGMTHRPRRGGWGEGRWGGGSRGSGAKGGAG
jgi:hypothetical protein